MYVGELRMRERKTRIESELELQLNISWEREYTRLWAWILCHTAVTIFQLPFFPYNYIVRI